jgi:hypothetical protein
MLDMVRYLVVWNPVILVSLHFAFHLLGVDKPPHHHHALAGSPLAEAGQDQLAAAVSTAA